MCPLSSKRRLGLAMAAAWLLASGDPARAAEYHVALDGSDADGDGSQANPWRTVQYAINTGLPAQGGHTVIVEDGLYEEMNSLGRGFQERVVIRPRTPYGATLTNVNGGQEAVRIYVQGVANITIDGFVITNAHPSYDCPDGREDYYLIHSQDASSVTLSNNIIFGNNAPGTCNEVVKINRGAEIYMTDVVIRGNVLYDPANAGGADIIDSVRPGEIDIVDNIFWGNPDKDQSQSFITLKRQTPSQPDSRLPRYVIARNVFLNWGGKADQAFVQFGEDGTPEPEITDALIENNLFIGNSPAQLAGAVQLKGPRNVAFRFNTVVGDLPGGAYGFRVGTEGDNPAVQNIDIEGNIFSDPTGTMGDRFFNAYGDVDLATVELTGNLFWNNGNPLPAQGAILPSDDPQGLVADPGIQGDQSDLVLPRWDDSAKRFESGARTIREEFDRLVEQYGAIAVDSPARDAASGPGPEEDIRGLKRDSRPDLGAFEYGADDEEDGGTGDADSDTDGDADADADTDTDADADADSDTEPDNGGDTSGGCGCTATGSARWHLGITGLFSLLLWM